MSPALLLELVSLLSEVLKFINRQADTNSSEHKVELARKITKAFKERNSSELEKEITDLHIPMP